MLENRKIFVDGGNIRYRLGGRGEEAQGPKTEQMVKEVKRNHSHRLSRRCARKQPAIRWRIIAFSYGNSTNIPSTCVKIIIVPSVSSAHVVPIVAFELRKTM